MKCGVALGQSGKERMYCAGSMFGGIRLPMWESVCGRGRAFLCMKCASNPDEIAKGMREVVRMRGEHFKARAEQQKNEQQNCLGAMAAILAGAVAASCGRWAEPNYR
eukprot:COSAG01_NODE_372_length_17995_cov_16.957812_13_plen_107_part_00